MKNEIIPYEPRRLGRARKNFLKKVELLESWVSLGGVPDGTLLPSGPTELAKWESEEFGFKAWASPNITSPQGAHADLRARFDRVLKLLSPEKPKRSRKASEEERGFLKRTVVTLAEQNTELMEQVSSLKEELARERQLRTLAEKRESEANKKLVLIKPISLQRQEDHL
jgi:hypothetical protein